MTFLLCILSRVINPRCSVLESKLRRRQQSLCVRCTFFDSVFVSQPSAICVSEPRSVSRGFPVQTRTRAPLLIQHSDSGFQCYCDEVSPNRQHWAEIFPSLGCLWRNWRENPHFSFFFIGRNSLSILCPSLTPSCPTPAVIEVPCMRKTEQQPSAWTIFAQLDFFLSFLQCFSSFAHRKSKGRVRSMTSYPNTPFVRTQTSLSWLFSLLDDKVTVGHLVYVSVWRSRSGPSEVCVCSSARCVSLLASRPWWVAVLNSWK